MKLKKMVLIKNLILIIVIFIMITNLEKVQASVLVWPVPGHVTRSQGFHGGNAIDISDGSIAGATIVATIGGTVVEKYTCAQQHSGSMHNCYGYGTGLVIKGTDGRYYFYAHMMAGNIPSNINVGSSVKTGGKIGQVGKTGNATGNHLHFGIAKDQYGRNGCNPDNETYINSADTQPPVISNIKVTKQTSVGYTVSCTVTDNVGIDRVEFPTWRSVDTSVGCTWFKGKKSGNTWSFTFTGATKQDNYTTHVYAWDTSGNMVCGGGIERFIDKTAPKISNVKITNITKDGFTVSCIATDNVGIDRVQFPAWTSNNGQDDLAANWETNTKCKGSKNGNTFAFTVKRSDHKNEFGEYCTHIYAYDISGNSTYYYAPHTNVKADDCTNPSGHVYDKGKITKAATCGVNGVKTYTCTKCKKTKTEPIKATGNHKYDSGKITKQPTTSSTGIKTYTCTVCKATKTEVIPVTTITPSPKPTTTPSPKPTTTPSPNPTITPSPEVTDTPDSSPAPDESLPKGTLISNISGGTYRVTGNGEAEYASSLKTEKTVTIPDTIESDGFTYKVTNIDRYAFYLDESIEKIIIGNNVKSIGKEAFWLCSNLKSVKLGSSLETIEASAFEGCEKLKSISIPASVERIGNKAFNSCSRLKKIVFGKSDFLVFGKKVFTKVYKNVVVQIPKKNIWINKTELRQAGMPKKAKIKKK